MDLEEIASYWARFHISFSWDYPEGLDLQAVQQAVFHVVGESDARSQDQLVVGSVQSAGAGVILTQPVPVSDNVPCEMSFTAHPMSDDFCIKDIVIVSEARNVELYVDNSYAKTAKGIMLTIKKGRKVALFETEFDLSEYVHGKCKCAVKFLSFPNIHALRIQTIVVKVAKKTPSLQQRSDISAMQSLIPGAVDLTVVKEFIKTSGKELTPEAEKLLTSLEQLQLAKNVQLRQSRPRSHSVDGQNKLHQDFELPQHRFSVASDGSLLQQAIIRARELEEEEQYNKMGPVGSPESDDGYVNMLAGLMINKNNRRENGPLPIHNGEAIPNGDGHADMLAQARWEAYVQNRLRPTRQVEQRPRNASFVCSTSTPSLHVQGGHCYDEREALRHNMDSPPSPPLPQNSNKVSSAPELGSKSRCVSCGCPGCLSVYNSIATTIYATEERIMAKVENKILHLQRHIDSQFDALYQALQTKPEHFNAHNQGGLPSRRRGSAKVGDTSV
ncbi:uncharacterized protein LOC116296822 [Actinia tenebrosa]|uniref:Uncharacterized protein LOC116296822 n=1 Tax=Actinia tenebrosa TaxID=6105 RepID=A0A6P8HZR7_ACTTE|nr:uncharacterized protein LOC116296822 [Actinia tenebrosa]